MRRRSKQSRTHRQHTCSEQWGVSSATSRECESGSGGPRLVLFHIVSVFGLHFSLCVVTAHHCVSTTPIQQLHYQTSATSDSSRRMQADGLHHSEWSRCSSLSAVESVSDTNHCTTRLQVYVTVAYEQHSGATPTTRGSCNVDRSPKRPCGCTASAEDSEHRHEAPHSTYTDRRQCETTERGQTSDSPLQHHCCARRLHLCV